MHIPYSKRNNRKPDFKVKYSFYNYENGGRESLPFQGLRCDFSYYKGHYLEDRLFMIYPEFLDKHGNVITDNSKPVSREGLAYMWILDPKMTIEVHRDNIKVGVKGYFKEGNKKVGEVEVIEVFWKE